MDNFEITGKALLEKEIRERVLEIRRMAASSSMSKRKDIECWNMYNEIYNERDFDYLRKIGQYEFPAKMRWIGVQRKGVNLLVSQQSRRLFPFSVTATDVESKKEKYEAKFWTFLNTIDQRVKQINSEYVKANILLDKNKQKMQEFLQQPIDENASLEEQQKLQQQKQQIQDSIPLVEQQLQEIKDQLKNQSLLSNKDIQKVEKFYRYDFRDLREQKAQAGMKKIRTKLNIKQKSIKNFISKVVTGKEYWFVELRDGEKLPTCRPVDTLKVYYPINDEVFWVEEGDWVVVEELASFEQVKKEFGPHLTYQQLEYLKRYRGSVTPSAFVSTPGSGAYLHDNIYAGTLNTSQNIRVWRVYFREEREILARQMPNPHVDGKYFTHFVDQEDIKKKPIRENKGEKLVKRYVDDIYEGVVIIADIVPYVRKKKYVWRSVDDYSRVPLPVHGKTHNNITDRPYSLIWATKDLQILLNLIHYHRELMLSASGVKGMVMDIAQKPASMSMQEWVYQKKIGNAWIETSRKGRQVPTSYNQFKEYDETISSSIQYLDNLLENLDRQIMNIMGISYQRMGQMVSSDPVGTSQMAIDQSALVTEILYSEHDETERRALTHALNLATRYCWSAGELLDITDSKNGNEFVKINPGELDDRDFDVYLENSTKEEQDIQNFKQLALQEGFKGTMAFEQALSIYNTDTLKELEKKFEYFKAEAAELQQMNSQNQLEMEIQKQERIEKLKFDFASQLEQQKMQVEAAKLKIEQGRLEWQQQSDTMKMQIEQKRLDNETQLKAAQISSEREIESQYLSEENRANTVSEQLQAIQIQLQALIHNDQMAQDIHGKELDHKHDMKKLDIDKAKASVQKKERIK